MTKKKYWLFFNFIILTAYAQSDRHTFYNFPQKLSDTLCTFIVKKCELVYLSSNPNSSPTLKKKLNGFLIKKRLSIDKKILNNIINTLTDTLSFTNSGLTKSCAFEPELLLELSNRNNRSIYIVLSLSCKQVAIVTGNFKIMNGFGDLSEKGSKFFVENFYKTTFQ